MPGKINGFPAWEVRFNATGSPLGSGADDLLAEIPAAPASELFIMSHGWNNNEPMARRLYERFFGQLSAAAHNQGVRAKIGVAGAFWPSMRWPDEDPGAAHAGGAAGVADITDANADADDAAVIETLRRVYEEPEERDALDEIEELLQREPDDSASLARFQRLLGVLAAGPDAADALEDGGEQVLLSGDPEAVFTASAELAPSARVEGAARFRSAADRLWTGARQALRQATYWKMKKRAAIVAVNGLAPLVMSIADAVPAVRIHLVGHSFGARLVSYTLKGLPDTAVGSASPVKSVLLLQGAFSHFAFATDLPHDPGRAGGLAGMQERIDGPLLATHSKLDLAVGNLYPWASIAGRDDATAFDDQLYRWGAIGHDGAQYSSAEELDLGPPGERYEYEPGRIYNLDANHVIVTGEPPSGAHSDIVHPEIAWAALSASRLV